MGKTIRIKTTPGGDDKQIKIDLNQDFDFIEFLSLKLAQSDLYSKFCADYGAVVGRVIANDGFGVPNAKVSIFIPIDDFDEDNALIKSLYPYKSTRDKNSAGIRYNVLPDEAVDDCHQPVGTFPSKQKVLDNNLMLYLYEKYYKLTTVTNEAGDFMIFGVPLGEQILHFDIDYSDIGFLSLRPYDMIDQGASENLFPSKTKFATSTNLDSLPQIESADIPVNVTPFWGDEENCNLGIARIDLNLKRKIVPNAFFFGSIFTDNDKNVINKNCRPNKKLGQAKDLTTGSGSVETIYRDIYGNVQYGEEFDVDDNGNWAAMIPMNLAYMVTTETGEMIPSPDPTKGVPTESEIRFRLGMIDNEFGKVTTAKFLVPNMFGNYNFRSISADDPAFNDYLGISPMDGKKGAIFPLKDETTFDISNPGNKLRDFFTMRWKKVYTVRQYIARYQPTPNDENNNFVGIKAVEENGDNNPFPFNRHDAKAHPLFAIICYLLTIFALLVTTINTFLLLIGAFITKLCNIRIIPCDFSFKAKRGCLMQIKDNLDTGWYGRFKAVSVGPQSGSITVNTIRYFSSQNRSADTFSGYQPAPTPPDTSPPYNAGEPYYTSLGDKPWVQAEPIGANSCEDDIDADGNYDYFLYNHFGTDSPNWDDELGGVESKADCYICDKENGTRWKVLDWGGLKLGNSTNIAKDRRCGKPKNYVCADCVPTSCNTEANVIEDGFREVNLGFLGCLHMGFKAAFSNIICCGLFNYACAGVKCCGEDCGNEFTHRDRRGLYIQPPGPIKAGETYTVTTDGTVDPTNSGIKVKYPPSNSPNAGTSFSGQGATFVGIASEKRISIEKTHTGTNAKKCECKEEGCTGGCCEPVQLIKLKCSDAGGDSTAKYKPVFQDFDCGDAFCEVGFDVGCVGPAIDDVEEDCAGEWLQCILSRLANTMDVFDFEFYNDWINGSLYAFKLKRKLKVRRRKKKTYDKFCDVNCTPDKGTGYQDKKEIYDYDASTASDDEKSEAEGFEKSHNKKNYCRAKKNIVEKKEYAADKDCQYDDCKADGLTESKCGGTCGCDIDKTEHTYEFRGGVVKEHEDQIYYAAFREDGNADEWMSDRPKSGTSATHSYEMSEPKKYMLFPTDITDLGSSVICDIDNVPYFVDKLPRTSFDKYDMLEKYACLGCMGTKCVSTRHIMLHSQLGVDIDFDTKELLNPNGGVTGYTDVSYVDYDTEVREHLAKKFRTFPGYNEDFIYVSNTSSDGSENGSPNENKGDGMHKTGRTLKYMYFDFGPARHIGNVYNTNLNSYKGDNTDPKNIISGKFMKGQFRQTPYYFYFGIKRGATAIDKLRTLYLDGCTDNVIL